MLFYAIKTSITLILIIAITEVTKRSTLIGAILASVPLISVMAMIWLYNDTGDTEKISALSMNIFWLVLPSLALFVSLPVLLKKGINFYVSLAVSIAITICCYGFMIWILDRFNIKI